MLLNSIFSNNNFWSQVSTRPRDQFRKQPPHPVYFTRRRHPQTLATWLAAITEDLHRKIQASVMGQSGEHLIDWNPQAQGLALNGADWIQSRKLRLETPKTLPGPTGSKLFVLHLGLAGRKGLQNPATRKNFLLEDGFLLPLIVLTTQVRITVNSFSRWKFSFWYHHNSAAIVFFLFFFFVCLILYEI